MNTKATQNIESRIEQDFLGSIEIPHDAYYGIQTQRAKENFNISGQAINAYPELVIALAMVKKASASANCKLQILNSEAANAIEEACSEIIDGNLHDQFVVDVIQGGAGTSTNMNANEVIANRALELMGYKKGEYEHLHPNNHVNLSQSTNDVYPTAIRLAIMLSTGPLILTLDQLKDSFLQKADEFSSVLKIGRTQLQDAVPMTLGQEFEAFAVTLGEDKERLQELIQLLSEVNIGGTAIGTGLNAHAKYPKLAVDYLSELSGFPLKSSKNLIEATSDVGIFVLFSGMLKRLAIKLSKISNDLRLLSSGPVAGMREINLPPVQPGSSIMPGKVNPVIPESVNQTAFSVIGNDAAITMAAEAGQLQLNAMEPLIASCSLHSIKILKRAMESLRIRCIEGITANKDVCKYYVENSLGIVAALNSRIGYERSSRLARQALETGKGIFELVLEENLIEEKELNKLLDPNNMIMPTTT